VDASEGQRGWGAGGVCRCGFPGSLFYMTRCTGGWGKKVALGHDKNHFGDVKKESSSVNGFGFARSGYGY